MELISLYSSGKRKPVGCSGEGREFDDGVPLSGSDNEIDQLAAVFLGTKTEQWSF